MLPWVDGSKHLHDVTMSYGTLLLETPTADILLSLLHNTDKHIMQHASYGDKQVHSIANAILDYR